MPSFSFVSGATAVLNCGATPVFADIEPDRLTLDPQDVQHRITGRTKVIMSVHHGGQLADLNGLSELAGQAGLKLLDDAAHAVGALYGNRPVGTLAAMTCFSFSAVKNLTTGDGGMVTTNDPELAGRVADYRSLGISRHTWNRYGKGTEERRMRWDYDICTLGQRIHMNDLAAAIGLIQLRRLDELNARRAALARVYHQAFSGMPRVRMINAKPGTSPSWHMCTVIMDNRDAFIDAMRAEGITIGVHYYPLHLYPIFAEFRTFLPVTESLWKKATTFPLYPTMSEAEQSRVIECTRRMLSTDS
jgi:perosamine synthetase